MKLPALAVVLSLLAPAAAIAGDPPTITLDSLLKEMTDREAIARFPDPAYTCKQFSSYDRKSTTPDDPKTWFANGDANQYLRVEDVKTPDGKTHKEWVMADMDGPGAIVRIWSANPAGTLRIYLDNSDKPIIEAPMNDLLGGKWKVSVPLSQECSKGWNLYLPIPYAKHCKITSDKDGFYYQVNYRTYANKTPIRSLTSTDLDAAKATIEAAQNRLSTAADSVQNFLQKVPLFSFTLSADGEARTSDSQTLPPGPHAITWMGIEVEPLDPADLAQALRSTVVSLSFDGEQTVWAPLGDFFGVGVGAMPYRTWWIDWPREGTGIANWVMPYEKSAKISFEAHGNERVRVKLSYGLRDWSWDSRSMHFHANWHYEYPIHAYGARGTKDWNYIEAQGKGVYVGDTLAVMNPVKEWWGEGDEKIYIDGEKFPSHFGTGTEDYYGYAWCWPVAFQHPFHAQPRVDGNGKDNWGHTTVTRVRSLDAIPFTKSLKFDMEVWHWKECDEAYAATTYWYALPGATCNRPPQPEDAAKPIPQPPPRPQPFTIPGAIECELMEIAAKSPGATAVTQDMESFARGKWSGESQLWFQGAKPGDFVELRFPVDTPGPRKVTLYATKSWDYGIVRFSINGKETGKDVDLSSGQDKVCTPSGPIELGTFEPQSGKLTLRAEVIGKNPTQENAKPFFGLDCVVLKPAP